MAGIDSGRFEMNRRSLIRGVGLGAVSLAGTGLLAAGHDLGLDVPADLSVVGFDDVPHAQHLRPALTTIRQDFPELGRRAIALLLHEIEGTAPATRPTRVLPCMIVRDSTAEVTIEGRSARPA